ncbi:hypothetical protein DL96DRAFT_1823381 [Flagelloscypha sp. PMI_526]|nr:hypothetical protein DL96DRAFT_1823381 [Flagelloscypha sp. PMI_526]
MVFTLLADVLTLFILAGTLFTAHGIKPHPYSTRLALRELVYPYDDHAFFETRLFTRRWHNILLDESSSTARYTLVPPLSVYPMTARFDVFAVSCKPMLAAQLVLLRMLRISPMQYITFKFKLAEMSSPWFSTLAPLASGSSHPTPMILSSNLSLYPPDPPNFRSSGLNATFTPEPTHLGGSYLDAINNTSTSVTDAGSVGIIGLGFPLNSAIWGTVLPTSCYDITTTACHQQRTVPQFSRDCSTAFFPHFEWLTLKPRPSNIDDGSSMTSHALASYSSQGPLLLRLIELNRLSVPGFTVSLQEFPPGWSEEDFSWVSLRHNPPSQGGLHPSNDAPDEEIYLDDVYLDVPRSNLLSPIIVLSALVGNSLLRVPPDVVSHIYHAINQGPVETFPCDAPHMLAFEIGVHPFPVDPRNFVSHTFENQVELCTASLVGTDVPALNEEGLNSSVPPDAEGRLKEVAEQANGKRKRNLEQVVEELPSSLPM